jgi:hypothetical protein
LALAFPRGRAVPARESDSRQRIRLAVLLDFVDVVVARPGKADQLPAGEIAVAAVDRVGEKALAGVLPSMAKNSLAGAPASSISPFSSPWRTLS